VEVREDDSPESLQLRVMKEAEQVILPRAVRLFAENKIMITTVEVNGIHYQKVKLKKEAFAS